MTLVARVAKLEKAFDALRRVRVRPRAVAGALPWNCSVRGGLSKETSEVGTPNSGGTHLHGSATGEQATAALTVAESFFSAAFRAQVGRRLPARLGGKTAQEIMKVAPPPSGASSTCEEGHEYGQRLAS